MGCFFLDRHAATSCRAASLPFHDTNLAKWSMKHADVDALRGNLPERLTHAGRSSYPLHRWPSHPPPRAAKPAVVTQRTRSAGASCSSGLRHRVLRPEHERPVGIARARASRAQSPNIARTRSVWRVNQGGVHVGWLVARSALKSSAPTANVSHQPDDVSLPGVRREVGAGGLEPRRCSGAWRIRSC